MKQTLPSSLTSYDLLKTLAVITMVIDHAGFYFFPDHEWWRAVGRLSFPIWFFLIGYASTRDISPKLWGGALMLIAANIIIGMPVLALNALVTIMAIRLVLDKIMNYAGRSAAGLAQVGVFMALLALPTSLISEYGTIGLLFAMFGYVMRRHGALMWPHRSTIWPLMLGCFFSYIALQQIIFGFSAPAFWLVGGGTLGLCLILLHFRACEYAVVSARIPVIFKAPVQFMGRRTLEIYVLHLLVFKALAAALYPETYPLFELRLF